MTLSATRIANLALAELPHPRITSIAEDSVAAENVREQLPQVLGELLEGGEWGFAIKRHALTPITNHPNDTWAGAFVVPADLAMPLKVIPATSTNGSAILSVGQRIAYSRDIDLFPVAFDFEGRTIWTNEANPVLEYVVNNPDYNRFTKTFERVLALTLAGRLVLGVTGKRDQKNDLLGEAQLLKQRALARDLNNNPTQNTYGQNYIPSVLMGHVEAPE
jgi:hypothetical protein